MFFDLGLFGVGITRWRRAAKIHILIINIGRVDEGTIKHLTIYMTRHGYSKIGQYGRHYINDVTI